MELGFAPLQTKASQQVLYYPQDKRVRRDTPPTVKSVARLPRYFALKSPAGLYLTLDASSGTPYLSFTSQNLKRPDTHEAIYNSEDAKLLMVRSCNDRFWRRTADGSIVADKLGVPNPKSDKDCYFEFTVNQEDKVVELQLAIAASGNSLASAASGFNKLIISGNKQLKVIGIPSASDNRLISVKSGFMKFSFTDASATAVKLPSYVMFKNNDGEYVRIHEERSKNVWLQFNGRTRDLQGIYSVIPLQNGHVAIQTASTSKFWRNSGSWIWADVSTIGEAEKSKECHFEPFKLGDNSVALGSLSNSNFLRMYTDFWEKCLCANANAFADAGRLTVEDAVSTRNMFNIKFLLPLAEVVEGPTAEVVGRSVVQNKTSKLKVDMATTVIITNAQTRKRLTTLSNTFTMENSVKVSASFPEIATVEVGLTITNSQTTSEEVGKEYTEAVQFQNVFTVKDIPPNTKATVELQCTRAKFNVPFTYSMRSTRFDGADAGEQSGVDGVFEGVSVFDVQAVITEDDSDVVVIAGPTWSPVPGANTNKTSGNSAIGGPIFGKGNHFT